MTIADSVDERVDEYLDQIEELSHKLSVAENKLQQQQQQQQQSPPFSVSYCLIHLICRYY